MNYKVGLNNVIDIFRISNLIVIFLIYIVMETILIHL